MPDNKSINLGDLNVTPQKEKVDATFDYYKQGSNVSGTDSAYFPKEDQSILLTQDDINDVKALNQSTVSKLSNDLIAATGKTASGLVRDVGLLIGGTNYLLNAANPNADATYEDFKNPLVEGSETFDKWIDEAIPHYLTTDEKDNPAAARNLFSSAFLGKTILRDAVPFAATAYLEGMGLGKIATTGTKALYAQRLAKLGGEFSEQGAKLAKSLNWSNRQAIGTLVNYNEAAFESLQTSDRVYEEVYNNLLKEGVSEDLASKEAKAASDNAFENSFLINFAVLRATDYQFDGLFKSTLNSRRGTKEVLNEISNKEAFLIRGKELGKNIISESTQELTQGATSDTLVDQAYDEKTGKVTKDSKVLDTFGNALSSIPQRVTTDDGIIEMLSSAIIAGGFTGANKLLGFKDERNQRSFIKEQFDKSIAGTTTLKPEDVVKQTTDKFGNINQELTQKGKDILNEVSNFSELEIIKNSALAGGNLDLYQKAFTIQLSNMAYGHFEAGLGEEFESKLRDQISTLKSDLVKSGKKTITDHETGKQVSPEEYVQKTIERAKKYEDIYNSLQDQFDIQNPEIRKTAYLNAIQQTETKAKINSSSKAIGESFVDYVQQDPDLAKLPLNEAYNKVLSERDKSEDITKKATLQVLLDDYKKLSELNVNGSVEEIQTNKTNLSSNVFNKKYFRFLKNNFDLLVNPDAKIQKEFQKEAEKINKRDSKIETELTETIKKEQAKKEDSGKSTVEKLIEETPEDFGNSLEDFQKEFIKPESLIDKIKQSETPGAENISSFEGDSTDFNEFVESVEKSNEELITIPSVDENKGSYLGEVATTGIKVAYLSKSWSLVETDSNTERKNLEGIVNSFVENSNPSKLGVGTKLVIKKEKAKEKYSYIEDSKGNISYELDSEGNPLKKEAGDNDFNLNIYDQDNNYVGSIHEPEWLLASKNGVYINATEEVVAQDYPKLVQIWKNFDKPVVVSVLSKSTGKLNTQKDNKKPVFKSLKESIGKFIDNRTKQFEDGIIKPIIGVTSGTNILFGKRSVYSPEDNSCANSLVNNKGEQYYNNGSVVLLGEAANGQDIILPLNINKLQTNKDTVKSLIRLLRVKSKADIESFQSLGFNSFNGSTVKEYLSNFIYLYDYSKNKYFNDATKNQPIKIGIKTEGDLVSIRAVYLDSQNQVKTKTIEDLANVDIAELDSFLKDIDSALLNSYFNIDKSKLSSYNEEFKIPVFENNKIKEIKSYKNYVDFLSEESLSTDIREFGNGYLFLQPVVALNQEDLNIKPKEEEKEITPDTEKKSTEDIDWDFEDENIISINPSEEKESLESKGLTESQLEYLLEDISKYVIKDSEGNKLETYNKQDLFKNLILSQSLKGLRNSEVPSKVFSDVYKAIQASLKNLDLYKKITSENYNQAKNSQKAPEFLKNTNSFEDFKNKLYTTLKSENDLRFIIKPEVFNQFIEVVKKDLKRIYKINVKLDGNVINEEETLVDPSNDLSDTDDSNQQLDEVGDKEKRSAQADSSEIDPRKHLSWKMKMFLSDIPMEQSYNGLNVYYAYDTVYNKVLDILSNPVGFSFEEVVNKLLNSNNYIAIQVANKLLAENNEQLKNQFITATLLEKSNFVMEDVEIKDGLISSQVINSNRNDTINRLLDDLNERLKESSIIEKSSGELYINKEEVKKLVSSFEKAQKGDVLAKTGFVRTLFKSLNLPINEKVLNILTNDNKLSNYYGKTESLKTFNDLFNDKGLVGIIVNTVSKNIDNKEAILFDSNNPFKGESKQGATSKLATIIADSFNVSGATVFKNLEGKSFYAFNLRTYLSDTFYKLKNSVKEAKIKMNNAFSSTSVYLKDFSNYIQNAKLNYFDGMKTGKTDSDKNRRPSFDVATQMLSFLNEFNASETNANFFVTTLSDKTKSPLFNLPVNNAKIVFNDKGEITFDAKTVERIYNIINAEYKRISEFKNYEKKFIDNGGTKEELKYELGNYYDGATKFFLFEDLNNQDISKLDLRNVYIPNKLREIIAYTESKFTEAGLKLDSVPTELKNKYGSYKEDQKLKAVLANVTINYMEFYTNYMQLIGGDPALFWKKDIKTTLEEYTKREAKDIAPGSQGNWKNNLYNVVFVKSLEVDLAETNSYINKLFGKKSYIADTTDAQEFTTIKEHLDVMYAFGKISEESYNSYTEKLAKNKDYEFSSEELKEILSDEVILANKPVQVNSVTKTTQDGLYTWNSIYYIKSSSIPLLPQYTKGTTLDTIRKAMEKSNTNRFAFDSAVKAGKSKVLNIFDPDDTTSFTEEQLVEMFQQNQHELNRQGFRIQQETPYKKDKKEIVVVSQMNKLIFDNIADINFNFNGNTLSGSQLKSLKEDVRKQLFTISANEISDKLGLKIVNDSYEITNLDKLIGSLREEALDRGYPINDIESLTLDADGKLIIPLAYNNSFAKFESLIASIFSKIVLQKQRGKSFVQSSAVGLKYLGDVNQSETVYTPDFDSSKGLQYIDENKPYVEVLIPWSFEGDIKDYITDGKIDFNKLDPKLLEFVGARIPNQSFSSQLPIKVVGFLPEVMKDLIVIPNGITKQMGSDFDIDKLYTYISNSYKDENGNLKAVDYNLADFNSLSKQQLQNLYKDIHWSILTNEEVLKRVVSPLDKDDLKEETKLILKTTKEGSSEISYNPLLWVNQINNYDSQKAAKQLVGSSSLYTTFNTLIQELNIKLSKDFIDNYGTIDLFGKELEYLSNPDVPSSEIKTEYNGETRTVSDNLITLQNAFLDNAKDPVAGKLGINENSFGPIAVLTMLKTKEGESLNLSYIARFVKQPTIQEYLKRIAREKSALSDNKFFNVEDIYLTLNGELDNELSKFEKSKQESKKVNLNTEDLLQLLNPNIKKDFDYYNKQKAILETFYKLQKISDVVNKLQTAINSDSKGVAKNFIEILDKTDKIKQIRFDNSVISGISDIFEKDNIPTEIGLATTYATEFPVQVFKNLLPFTHDWYLKIEKGIQKSLGRENLSKDLRNTIWKSFRSFMFTNPNLLLVEDDIKAERERLLKGNNSLAHRLMQFKDNPLYANNLLIQRLYYKLDDKTINRVEYVASSDESTEEQQIVDSFLGLLTGDSNEQSFAKDLITYNYLVGGNQTAVSFTKYIPASYLFTTNYKDIDNPDYFKFDQKSFVRQFVQNNYKSTKRIDNEEFTTLLKKSNGVYIPSTLSGNRLVDDEGKFKFAFLSTYDTPNKKYTIFELDQETNTYKEIPIAGTPNVGFEEYDYSKPMIISVIDNNNPKNIKSTGEELTVATRVPNKEITNSLNPDVEYTMNLFKSNDKKGLVDVVKNIRNTTTNESFKTIADLILASDVLLNKDLKITISSDKGPKGIWKESLNNKELILHPKSNRVEARINNTSFEEVLNETILHETLHGLTHGIIKRYKANPKDNLFTTNPRLEALLNNLSNLHSQAKVEYNKIKENLSGSIPEDVSLISTFDSKYEATEIDEFIVRALTDKNLQKFLSRIENKNRSLFDKITETVVNILKEIGRIVGLDLKQLNNSILKETILTSNEIIEIAKNYQIENETSSEIKSESLNSLGTTVVKYMQSLNAEEREIFRNLVKSGVIKTSCD